MKPWFGNNSFWKRRCSDGICRPVKVLFYEGVTLMIRRRDLIPLWESHLDCLIGLVVFDRGGKESVSGRGGLSPSYWKPTHKP